MTKKTKRQRAWQDLENEVGLLRAHILGAEWASVHSQGYWAVCPWCRGMKLTGHFFSCPVFAARGELR